MAAKRIPQAILSDRDDGNDVHFEEWTGGAFVCRKCTYHARGDDVRLYHLAIAIRHLDCHLEDGHRIDPKAMQVLRGRLLPP